MQQPPNPYPHYPQHQWQQQPDYTQPQSYTHQYQQPPRYQPPRPSPKKKSRKRLWLILAVIVVVLAVIIGVASQGQSQKPTPAAQQTQATQAPTKAPVPNLARLGGTVHDFDLKFGKEDTSQGGIGYQPFGSYSTGLDLPTDKYDILVDNGHVMGVRVTLPKESPLSWQDGTTLCQSFLPTDAVYQSANDAAPLLQVYQQVYISKKMASMFSADHFIKGSGVGRTQDTPGTIQITYYYSSFGDHTDNAQITSCDIELGEPN